MAQGVSTTLQQATFSIGMKGITDKGKIGELEELIHSTIKDLAASGFDSSVMHAWLSPYLHMFVCIYWCVCVCVCVVCIDLYPWKRAVTRLCIHPPTQTHPTHSHQRTR